MRKFKARRLCAVLALMGLAAFLFVVASPVSANHVTGDGPPPASLHPDDDAPGGDGTRLSDRFDGTDSAAHLTALAGNNITRVQWRACPTSVSETTPTITQADVTSCNVILGEDTTGASVGAGTVLVSPDKAFDITVDFSVTLDTPGGAGAGDHDVLVLACVGAGEDVEGSDANCTTDVEENIFFDDASTGDPDTTSGEIVSVCTSDTDAAGPDGAGTELANPCQYDTDDDGDFTGAGDADTATERAAVDARFKPWKHGDPVPDNGFVIRATTSPDLNDTGELIAHIANPVSATQDPDAQTGTATCTVISPLADRSTFECNFDNVNTPAAGTGISVYLHNNGIGTGFCAAAHCQLDSHGSVVVTRAPTTAVIHLGPTSTTSNCAVAPKTAETVTADQVGDTPEIVQGCFLDQFGSLIAADFAFQITPVDTNAAAGDPSGFLGVEGTETDANTDFFFEAVKGALADMAGDAIADQTVELELAQAYTITFCRDLSSPLNAACDASDLPKTTATKTVTAGAAEDIRLVFRSRTPPAPTRTECFTGPTTAQNNVGDRDNLLACVFDAFLNLKSTLPAADAVRLDFAIAPSGGGEVTATRFPSGSPPPADTDASGFATAVVEAFCRDVNADGVCDQGNDIITATLREADGGTASSSVQKRVTGGAPPPAGPPVACTINGTAGNDILNGTPGADVICGLAGNDTIRGLGGDDIIFGGDGNDLIFGGDGADRANGQGGADRINLGEGNDRGWGGGGEDRIWGLGGNDVIYGNTDNDPNLRGGTGNDSIVGGSGSDGLVGDAGNDRGWGQSGNDRLFFRDNAADGRVNGGGGVDLCGFDRGLDLVSFCP